MHEKEILYAVLTFDLLCVIQVELFFMLTN